MSAVNLKLTLGPVFFHWKPDTWRDFYFRIADEADVDSVHVGEVICSKRMPFYEKLIPEVMERLTTAGKEVVLSSQALIMSAREQIMAQDLSSIEGVLIEANDITVAALLEGREFVVGPFINVYNEGTLGVLEDMGAIRICLPAELPEDRLIGLAVGAKAELEVQAFGRMPLAISARCYAARARNLLKDGCLYVCAEDPDGMTVKALDNNPLFSINGTQTLSYRMVQLLTELPRLRQIGVDRLRLSPQMVDMVSVANLFRATLNGTIDGIAAVEKLHAICPTVDFANGYFHGAPGYHSVDPD